MVTKSELNLLNSFNKDGKYDNSYVWIITQKKQQQFESEFNITRECKSQELIIENNQTTQLRTHELTDNLEIYSQNSLKFGLNNSSKYDSLASSLIPFQSVSSRNSIKSNLSIKISQSPKQHKTPLLNIEMSLNSKPTTPIKTPPPNSETSTTVKPIKTPPPNSETSTTVKLIKTPPRNSETSTTIKPIKTPPPNSETSTTVKPIKRFRSKSSYDLNFPNLNYRKPR
ncbi:unnamed protein product [Candida verbasci]|uniref:Uncharacterized protein n=1 Tax=Candida verbasci TaxID=1227364 RepID=A0A9W4XD32_9ASCO|nr:unnamed protein product [Candida verbasci]